MEQLEQALCSIKHAKQELQIALGRDRYEKVVEEIKEVLLRNDLNEYQAHELFNHLSDIYRLERIHVFG